MMIYSKREQKFHFEQLTRAAGALKLTDWEASFVESVEKIPFERLTEKQRQTISKIYDDRKDSAS